MFYDIYCKLCSERGLTPSGAATKIGFNRASVTMWKNTGKPPKPELLDKIAAFFDVTTDFLLEKEQKEKSSSKQEKDITFDDFTYAMYGAGQTLTEEQKQTLLDMARFLQSQNEQKDKP